MKSVNRVIRLVAAVLVVACALLLLRSTRGTSSARPSAQGPVRAVLAELFTSEGCSSCPLADALLGKLREEWAKQGVEVIPLGFHVDYWNSLGWKDRFSAAEFSRRQEQYARILGGDGPYTPQMIVDGGAEFVGSDRERARTEISAAARQPRKAGIELSLTAPDRLRVKADAAMNRAVVMLAITEDNLSTRVGAGENNGRELRHAAVVRELRPLGKIQNGSFKAEVSLQLEKEWKPADLRAVAFVQREDTGEVLGAASVPLHAEQR